jgi:hypothetical protein
MVRSLQTMTLNWERLAEISDEIVAELRLGTREKPKLPFGVAARICKAHKLDKLAFNAVFRSIVARLREGGDARDLIEKKLVGWHSRRSAFCWRDGVPFLYTAERAPTEVLVVKPVYDLAARAGSEREQSILKTFGDTLTRITGGRATELDGHQLATTQKDYASERDYRERDLTRELEIANAKIESLTADLRHEREITRHFIGQAADRALPEPNGDQPAAQRRN